MAILTLSGSSSDLNAYPSASVSYYNSPYGALKGVDGDITTFTGLQTNGTPNQFYQILFNTSSITGEAQENLLYGGIQSLEIIMSRNTSGRIAFVTNPEGNETDEEFPYQNPAGLEDSSLYTVNINPQRGLDRAYNRSLGETKIYGLRIYFDAFYAGASNSVSDARIYEIIIDYHLPKKDLFEFNDSVLSTKAWNSSRYDGKQLQASQINLATRDDVGNDSRTPIVQKYTRNIYIGSRIIGMQAGNVEDGSLLNFDGFSYITVHEFITVNDDLTITKRSVRGDKPNTNFNNKKGFYKSWYQDFPLGSTCEIKVLDRKVEQSLKPSYRIYNNSGQLQKLLLIHQASKDETGYTASYRPYTVWGQPDYDPGSDNVFYFASESVSIGDVNYKTGADFRIYNKTELINEFFTGSLTANKPPFYPGGSGTFEDEFDSGDPK
tara:strand:+ start:867 stop:2174 length:1308 start_codon:yes stop_codon:yes gene_type:complete